MSTTGKNTWSYKSALKILEKHDEMRDGLNGLGGVRERTDVASIIAEARKNMKANNDKEDDDTENTSGDEEEQAGSNTDESESESEDSDDDDDDNNDDSDSGDESSDDEVDDAEKMKGMDQDVVRDRKAKLTKNMIREQDEEDSGSDDDDENDESLYDSEDEEAKKEAAKAAKYFDQSHFHSSQGVGEKVEVFAQLNLSRPLLRGVASIGFVSPTPIQAKVIPIALSGRDVCAR